ncbi:helix-turn-helix domain-containing protein [Aggregatimonas sangjinii]|nr:AraC family transcriptional regulator [Aggregatimonas sangjinii]
MALKLSSSNVMEVLQSISKDLGGHFEEGIDWARMTLDNKMGKGTMTATYVFPGMGAITYDIEFHKDFAFTLVKDAMDPMYFIFCQKGHFKHKYGKESAYSNIENQQNVILKGTSSEENEVVIPENVPLLVSMIYIDENRLKRMRNNGRKSIALYLDELFSEIDDDKPFRYLGKVRPMTSEYVKLLIENKKKGIVGRMITESLIFRILSSQIEDHDSATENDGFSVPLRKTELNKIVSLGQFITENISSTISIDVLREKSGLSPKKLQIGFRALFGMTVNSYISKVRLEKARELIETTEMTISEIVYSCGLSSRSYFSKVFFERYGVLPSDYKKSFVTQ